MFFCFPPGIAPSRLVLSQHRLRQISLLLHRFVAGPLSPAAVSHAHSSFDPFASGNQRSQHPAPVTAADSVRSAEDNAPSPRALDPGSGPSRRVWLARFTFTGHRTLGSATCGIPRLGITARPPPSGRKSHPPGWRSRLPRSASDSGSGRPPTAPVMPLTSPASGPRAGHAASTRARRLAFDPPSRAMMSRTFPTRAFATQTVPSLHSAYPVRSVHPRCSLRLGQDADLEGQSTDALSLACKRRSVRSTALMAGTSATGTTAAAVRPSPWCGTSTRSFSARSSTSDSWVSMTPLPRLRASTSRIHP